MVYGSVRYNELVICKTQLIKIYELLTKGRVTGNDKHLQAESGEQEIKCMYQYGSSTKE